MTVKWTEEMVTDLRQWRLDSLSAAEIASRFQRQGIDITRNSVIGKMHRLNIESPKRVKVPVIKPPPPPKRPAPPRKPPVEARQPHLGVEVAVPAPAPVPPPAPAPSAGPPKTAPIGLMALTDYTCRWPVTKGAPYLFCGADTSDPPYCVHHAGMSYTSKIPKNLRIEGK